MQSLEQRTPPSPLRGEQGWEGIHPYGSSQPSQALLKEQKHQVWPQGKGELAFPVLGRAESNSQAGKALLNNFETSLEKCLFLSWGVFWGFL